MVLRASGRPVGSGGGDPGHQSTKNYYIPLAKAEAFLN